MKKLLLLAYLSMSSIYARAEMRIEQDTASYHSIEEVSVVSFYRTGTKVGNIVNRENWLKFNKGQEPSFILSNRPSVFAYSDTGNEYGYAYFRMRGMDQTRVNMTMDGMPLNEGEDMGYIFPTIQI